MASPLLPHNPRGYFLLGHLAKLLEAVQDPLGFLVKGAREHGDVICFHFFNRNIYLLNHPKDIDYVLSRTNEQGGFFKSISRADDPLVRRVGGYGLLFSEGRYWQKLRRQIEPAFNRDQFSAYSEVMVNYTEEMLTLWRDGEIRDVHQDMMRLAFRIVGKTLFNADLTGQADGFDAAFSVLMRQQVAQTKCPFKIPLGVPTPGNRRSLRAAAYLDRIVYDVIRQRRASSYDPGDLLSLLLQAEDETGSRLTDKQVRDEIITFFVAGHETSANALTWVWYLLSQDPDVELRLMAELLRVLGERTPTFADLPRLHYTEMVVKEALRLYPPAWLVNLRQPSEDCKVGGCHVPAQTRLVMSQWVVQRDSRFFSEPESFMPERWTEEFERNLPRGAYFPFGAGPRLCIGRRFAMMEAVLLLATIAQKFQLKLAPGHPVVPEPMISLRPKHGMKMVVIERSKP
jgi:cytochrome P450